MSPHCWFILVYTWEHEIRERRYWKEILIVFQGEGERPRLTKNDPHLTWKSSSDNFIALCFDGHGRVLSEMFLAVSAFLFVLHWSYTRCWKHEIKLRGMNWPLSTLLKLLSISTLLRATVRENRTDLTGRDWLITSIFWLSNTFYEWCWKTLFLDF